MACSFHFRQHTAAETGGASGHVHLCFAINKTCTKCLMHTASLGSELAASVRLLSSNGLCLLSVDDHVAYSIAYGSPVTRTQQKNKQKSG